MNNLLLKLAEGFADNIKPPDMRAVFSVRLDDVRGESAGAGNQKTSGNNVGFSKSILLSYEYH